MLLLYERLLYKDCSSCSITIARNLNCAHYELIKSLIDLFHSLWVQLGLKSAVLNYHIDFADEVIAFADITRWQLIIKGRPSARVTELSPRAVLV